ncbi:MAG: hypothetical protein ACRC1H_17410, partial [Caldilineaceae bacterium]
MSGFQSYEWQMCDRSLTPVEQRTVRKLSSHIEVSSRGAQVDYEWGSFKHDPLKVLVQYFDAYLYFATWGNRTLAFRFPAGLLDAGIVKAFGWKTCLEFRTEGESQLLIVNLDVEDDPDGILQESELNLNLYQLAPLRANLMAGDTRALYLAWLRGAALGNDDEEVEPPVPPGLRELTPALEALCTYLALESALVQAAAEASAPLTEPATVSPTDVAIVPDDEARQWLVRLASGEANLTLKFKRRLEELHRAAAVPPTQAASARATAAEEAPAARGERTWADIRDEMERLRGEATLRRLAEEQHARLAQIALTREQEVQLWSDLVWEVDQKTAKGYDNAVAKLLLLYELYSFDERLPDFRDRL